MIDGLKPYDSYTDSGLLWLEEIPSHWKVDRTKTQFRLSIEKSGMDHGKELLSIYTHIGVRPRKDLEQKGNRASTTNDYWVVRKGDIIVNKLLAWMGAVGVSHYDGVTSPAYDILRPVKPLEPDYYHYLFRTQLYKQQFKIRSRGIMEMRLRLYFDQLGQIPLLCPPPEEQAAIVRFLDDADRRIRRYIRAKRQLIALLNEQKQAIIHHAITRGLDPHVKLKPSGVKWLGDVPEHWRIVRVKEVVTSVEQGWSPQCDSQPAGPTQWGVLKVGCVNGEFFNPLENKRLPNNLVPIEALEIRDGDILVSRANTRELLGLAALVVNPRSRLLLCDKLFRFRVTDAYVFPHYLVRLLRAKPSRVQIESRTNGASSSMQNIGKDVIRNLVVALPEVNEQQSISAEIERATATINTSMETTNHEIELLQEYRTRLITDVVTGKLDVREAAAALPDELEAVEPDTEELLDEDETTDDVELDTEPEEVEA